MENATLIEENDANNISYTGNEYFYIWGGGYNQDVKICFNPDINILKYITPQY